jgi:acyl-coenzyme A thioesterase PaaI-like protein
MDVEGDGPSLLERGEDAMMETASRRGTGYSTASLQVNFVRPVQATAEGTIRDSEGRLYAHGMTTCLILR